MTKVLVIDDHPIVREGLKRILQETSDIAVTGEAGNGQEALTQVLEKLAFDLAGETTTLLHEALSNREYQVVCLLASGKAVKEIADELALNVKTISTYRQRILKKMRLKNNAELTHYAVQHGLVT